MARIAKKTSPIAKKPTVKKTRVVPVKKTSKKETVKIVKKSVTKSIKTKMASGLHAPILTIDGKQAGTVKIPELLFGAKINKQLVAQAVRVYLSNQREGSANTKTRGEVRGSTRKIYKQKGTGRARHGGIRAPIFAGGGVAHGPRPHTFSMAFPKKMKRAALASILTSKFVQGDIVFVQGLQEITPKTKVMAKTLLALGVSKGCILVDDNSQSVIRASRNIDGIKIIQAANLNTYMMITSAKIIVPKEMISILEKTFIR